VFNFLAPIIAPALHGYFDVFAGLIQMFIFITLTMVYITNEIPNQE
jgi:F-type H+-transporting ATPase subunit a